MASEWHSRLILLFHIRLVVTGDGTLQDMMNFAGPNKRAAI